MDDQATLSVVIPVYNSAAILPDLLGQLAETLPQLSRSFEVVLVNDGSRDRSWETICRLCQTYPWARGINLMRNYGQHNAVLCGLRAARHEIIVTMDDDLQHRPDQIRVLLEKLAEGFDVVYGPPYQQRHGLWRDLASQVTKLALQAAMGAEAARQISSFRALRAQLRDAFAGYQNPHVNIDVLLTWGASRFGAAPVRHDPRASGVSNYGFRQLVTHSLNMMTGFSTLPLQVASLLGFGLTLFGAGVLAYVLGRYLISGSVVPGFPFLASIVAIFSGAQLFALGIIGEYLARMHFRLMDRPAYTVRAQTPEEQG